MENVHKRLEILIYQYLMKNPRTVASELGIDRPEPLYNIIKGKNKPSFETLLKIRNQYGVNINWLLDGSGSWNDVTNTDYEQLKKAYSKLKDELIFKNGYIKALQKNIEHYENNGGMGDTA